MLHCHIHCCPKVKKLYLHIPPASQNHQIIRTNIPVYQALGMHNPQAVHNGKKHVHTGAKVNLAILFQILLQGNSLCKIHDNISCLILLEAVSYPHNP